MRLLSAFLKASPRVKLAPLMVLGRAICINHCSFSTVDVEMQGYSGESREWKIDDDDVAPELHLKLFINMANIC